MGWVYVRLNIVETTKLETRLIAKYTPYVSELDKAT